MEEAYCGPAPTPATLLADWNFDPIAIVLCGTLLGLFVWTRRERPRPLMLAIALLIVLFVSPLCALTTALFSARAAHHVLLVAVIAPLLALSFPVRSGERTVVPLGGFVALHALTLWVWHLPQLYNVAISSAALYWTMQMSLLGTGVIMWRRILREGHAGPPLLALLATIVQMGMLGALLTFVREPIYAPHFLTTAPFGLSPLEDQQLAGLIMWVPAALPYLAVTLWLMSERLGDDKATEPRTQ
jgi:putative membrane protein